MAKKVDKYYRLKTNPGNLLHTGENEELVDENNQWEEITESEYNKRVQIRDLKIEIAKTDYVALKLAEVDGDEREALKQTYATQLAHRAEIRAQINELEEEL